MLVFLFFFSFLRIRVLFHHNLLVPYLPFSFFFLRKQVLFHHELLLPCGHGWDSDACLHDLLVPPNSGRGSGVCLPSSPFFPQEKDYVPS